ncbi:MAG TPA: signal peptidase II [Candidatus Dormibacteraeota bacterium]|nr:signal peptidase II [Candidatus Dormibacteraeota bacterium]
MSRSANHSGSGESNRGSDRDINRNPGAAWLWLSLGVLVADRATKFAIEQYTSVFFRHPIISDIVVLVHNQNPGIAFGFFSDSTSRWLVPLLLVGAVVMMVLLAWLLITGRAGGALAHSGLALILGGAAGNALDRVMHGGVTDFLEVRLGSFVWPAFNLADSAITIGAVLVLFELFLDGRQRTGHAGAKRA